VPWTRRQVRYLLSSGSPLSGGQKEKMVGELHDNPAMGHKKKGSVALKKKPVTESYVAGRKAPRRK
jgi:hypothetical protein